MKDNSRVLLPLVLCFAMSLNVAYAQNSSDVFLPPCGVPHCNKGGCVDCLPLPTPEHYDDTYCSEAGCMDCIPVPNLEQWREHCHNRNLRNCIQVPNPKTAGSQDCCKGDCDYQQIIPASSWRRY